jgi:UDP-glucose-4-epimerase GalE
VSTFLVTGGAGYVGSHVVVDLLGRGHKVVVFDNLSQGHRQAVPSEAKLVVGDLADRSAVAALFRAHKFDGILHFAANALVGESMKKPLLYVGDNVVNALNLIDAAVENGVRKMVVSSTCAIFGTPERTPIDEDTPKAPVNSYGEGKLMMERILHWVDQAHGLRSACLRYFNAAGADPAGGLGELREVETHLIPRAMMALQGHVPDFAVFGDDYDTPDGTAIRDYIHVTDLAAAHVLALKLLLEGHSGGALNLGTGNGFSVREILAAIAAETGRDVPHVVKPRRPGDPTYLVADPSAARATLNFRPAHSDLATIIRTAWAWHRKAHPLKTGAQVRG